MLISLLAIGAILFATLTLVVVLSAFQRKPVAAPRVPPAKVVVDGSRNPIDPPPSTAVRVSRGRFAVGMMMVGLCLLGLMVLQGLAGLGELASH
jgi:hypothetical protein